MRNVSGKNETVRTAVAHGEIHASAKTIQKIKKGKIGKGNVLDAATLAGISGAKKTYDLIPLCHPVRIDHVTMDIRASGTKVTIESRVTGKDRTGMEMEALTAVMTAALTIYDMCKPEDPAMKITEIYLIEKTGGKSGDWRRKR